mmetsp:Transcript_13898/g.37848  ORF Transcript_13898/g.37848 Transcript_13898/m.37848 type:complete len:404 (-) Transcript_13898:641-1852(-)
MIPHVVLMEYVLGKVIRHEKRNSHAVKLIECHKVHVVWPQCHSPKLRESTITLVSHAPSHEAVWKPGALCGSQSPIGKRPRHLIHGTSRRGPWKEALYKAHEHGLVWTIDHEDLVEARWKVHGTSVQRVCPHDGEPWQTDLILVLHLQEGPIASERDIVPASHACESWPNAFMHLLPAWHHEQHRMTKISNYWRAKLLHEQAQVRDCAKEYIHASYPRATDPNKLRSEAIYVLDRVVRRRAVWNASPEKVSDVVSQCVAREPCVTVEGLALVWNPDWVLVLDEVAMYNLHVWKNARPHLQWFRRKARVDAEFPNHEPRRLHLTSVRRRTPAAPCLLNFGPAVENRATIVWHDAGCKVRGQPENLPVALQVGEDIRRGQRPTGSLHEIETSPHRGPKQKVCMRQ